MKIVLFTTIPATILGPADNQYDWSLQCLSRWRECFFNQTIHIFPGFTYLVWSVLWTLTHTHTFGLAHWNAFDCILWRPPDKGYGSGIGTDIVGIIHAILSKLSRWCAEGFIQSWLKAINEFCNWKFFLWLCKQF